MAEAPSTGAIISAAQQYRSSAGIFRLAAQRSRGVGATGASGALELVGGVCADYIDAGAKALDEAAERMEREVGLPAQETPQATWPLVAPKDPSDDLLGIAALLNEHIRLLADLAESLARPDLTGDTHPYGDVIYGICLPYLVMASDELAAQA